MFVSVEGARVSLVEPNDFTRFHLLVVGEADADMALRELGVGWTSGDQAFVSQSGLVGLNPNATADWIAEVDMMAANAKKYGWWHEGSSSIAAHIVRA